MIHYQREMNDVEILSWKTRQLAAVLTESLPAALQHAQLHACLTSYNGKTKACSYIIDQNHRIDKVGKDL